MTRIQITFVAAIALLVAACISLSSPETAAAQSSAWRSEAAALLPPDATGLMGLDLDSARTSIIYQRLETNMEAGQRINLDEFAALTGFDPRRDISGIFAATWGQPGQGRQPYLAVLGGRFDLTDQALTMLETAAPKAGEHRGVAIYGLQDKNGEEDPRAYLAILDDETALLGIHDAVVAGIERSFSGGRSMGDNTALLARADEAAGAGQFWFVSDQPSELVNAAPEGVNQRHARIFDILRTMRETTFTADIVNGLDFDWYAQFGSAEDARMLADAARGLLAFARISIPPDHGEFLRFLDRLQIGSQAARVDLGVQLTSIELEQLLEAVEARKRPEGQSL